jgi:hypothetical protein
MDVPSMFFGALLGELFRRTVVRICDSAASRGQSVWKQIKDGNPIFEVGGAALAMVLILALLAIAVLSGAQLREKLIYAVGYVVWTLQFLRDLKAWQTWNEKRLHVRIPVQAQNSP